MRNVSGEELKNVTGEELKKRNWWRTVKYRWWRIANYNRWRIAKCNCEELQNVTGEKVRIKTDGTLRVLPSARWDRSQVAPPQSALSILAYSCTQLCSILATLHSRSCLFIFVSSAAVVRNAIPTQTQNSFSEYRML